MHLAVAEGPNHSPGYLPQAVAPWRTKLCIEYGALGSSANRDRISFSSLTFVPRLQPVEIIHYYQLCAQIRDDGERRTEIGILMMTYLDPGVDRPWHWPIGSDRT